MCDKIDISTLARFRLPGVAGVVLRKLRDDVWGLCGEGVPQSGHHLSGEWIVLTELRRLRSVQ